MTDMLSFSSDFPTADEAEWRRLVEKALKGRPPETLDSRTEHGLPVKALFRESDWKSAEDPSGFPGSQPYVRGGAVAKDAWLPWDIRQIVRHPDPARAQAEAMEALEHGVSSIELWIDHAAEQGVCVRRAEELSAIISEIDTELATVAVEAVGDAADRGIEVAALLAAAMSDANRQKALLAFNIDPVGVLVRTGYLGAQTTDVLSESVAMAGALAAEFPLATSLRVDSRPVHETGGTEVQEIAFMAATGASYMRSAISQGMSPRDASRMILFTAAVGGNYHSEISKLRAMRKVWARIAAALGGDGSMRLQAVTSRRMLSKRDPWSNLLRNTAACFAAGVGGADVVTVRGFTDAMGHAGSLARRLGRNTQIIAQEESGLGKVIDPAGGSWAFESIADKMARAAWALFQEIEAEGGIVASLGLGKLQGGIADARRARRAGVARRTEWLTGVNDFPVLDEVVPACEVVDSVLIASNAPGDTGRRPDGRSLSDLLAAAVDGATLNDLAQAATEGVECDPLWPIRLSEPYEALRDLADRRRDAGAPAQIFLATVGPLAEHSARLTFATNFFAAGGIAAVLSEDAELEASAAFKRSGCSLVCICGSDQRYAAEAEGLASALRESGAGRIYLAGKAGDNAEALRAAGVDEFIHVGVDVVASLELAHAELGVGS